MDCYYEKELVRYAHIRGYTYCSVSWVVEDGKFRYTVREAAGKKSEGKEDWYRTYYMDMDIAEAGIHISTIYCSKLESSTDIYSLSAFFKGRIQLSEDKEYWRIPAFDFLKRAKHVLAERYTDEVIRKYVTSYYGI